MIEKILKIDIENETFSLKWRQSKHLEKRRKENWSYCNVKYKILLQPKRRCWNNDINSNTVTIPMRLTIIDVKCKTFSHCCSNSTEILFKLNFDIVHHYNYIHIIWYNLYTSVVYSKIQSYEMFVSLKDIVFIL